MTGRDAAGGGPWWASGSNPDDGLDASEDPFDAHRRARQGDEPADPASGGGTGPSGEAHDEATADDVARLAGDAIDLVARLASEAGRRFGARSAANAAAPPRHSFTRPSDPQDSQDPPSGDHGSAWRRLADGVAPHADGRVCDACPVCIGLRALRQARPDVIAHLSDAAHHVSLALRALADAQAGDDGLEKIDLDQ